MSPALLAAFVGATALLMLIPGPNVALIAANTLTFGVRAGLMTVARTSAVMVAVKRDAFIGATNSTHGLTVAGRKRASLRY